MKKLIGVLLMLVLMASPVLATQVVTEIIDETLSPASTFTETDWTIADAEKVSFFVTYDSSRVTAAVSAYVTWAASVDGINWTDISWFDVAGGVTPQTSEALSLDGTYVGWLTTPLIAPQIRIRVDLKDAAYLVYGAGETAGITVNIVEEK